MTTPSDFRPRRTRLGWWALAPAVGLACLLYYAFGAWSAHVIDTDPNFQPARIPAPTQSRAVALASALIRREIDVHSWTANDPFFQPGWVLHDMPQYQQGIIAAIGRFAAGLAERNAEAAGGNYLANAASLLRYPPTIWRFDLSKSLLPMTSTEKQYRRAAYAFEDYNQALDENRATLDRRPEALAAALADIRDDLAATATTIEAAVGERPGDLFGRRPATVYYGAKGHLYADSLLLRELGWDYAQLISDRGLGVQWRHLLDGLAVVAAQSPVMVFNATPDSTLLPSHLAAQGFFILRARQQLAEIVAALGKPVSASAPP